MLKRRVIGGLAAAAVGMLQALAMPPAWAAESGASPAETRLEDRIVAVVNEDPILASDLDRLEALGMAERTAGEGDEQFRRRLLDLLIEEKLRFQEIDRFGFSELPAQDVEARLKEIRSRFPSQEAFDRRLAELELDPQELRNLVARQLLVLIFVEERLGPRVFVDLDQIRAYYNDVLTKELRARKEPVPPIDEVREPIRRLLKEKLLNEELVRWTEELRRDADVQNLLDEPRELPPVVQRIDSPKTPR
jgi:peptidyl-prolyl cis-trans isomerase SurA